MSRTICVIRNGISGELIVNGRSFNKPMEGIGSLTDLEIAEISTYLYNSWDRNKGLIDVLEVSEMVLACE